MPIELQIYDRLKVRTIKNFNNFRMDLRFDSVGSSFAFDSYFDPNNHDQEELYCVSHFHEVKVNYQGNQLIQGFILSQGFTDSSSKNLTQIAGYSLTGVLEDCQIPPEVYPLQYDGLSLREISTRILKPFNLGIVVDDSVSARMDIKYPETTAEPGQTIKEYLSLLAAQRNIIISHTTKGQLWFTQLNTKQLPVFHVDEGLIGYEMSMSFSGQPLHSHITVMKQADSDGGNAGEYTIKNPFVPVARVFRPRVIVQSSGNDNDTEEAAKNALAAELKNIVLTVKIDRWDINGKFLMPNALISVLNKELYIYKRTNFFIESIAYESDSEGERAVLTCVLPCCYDASVPFNIFVEPHFNSATGYTSEV